MIRPGWYFEDFVPGTRIETGTHVFSEDEIVAFAAKYDPQYFHTDPVAARESYFGGLIASGWHTLFTTMRLVFDAMAAAEPGGLIASPGFEDLRWHLPVRPGDRISAVATVADTRPSRSKPDRGLITIDIRAHNQTGALVCSLFVKRLVLRRPS